MYNNNQYGVYLLFGNSYGSAPPTLTVKHGALNACGNGIADIFGSNPFGSKTLDQFLPTSGKDYTCDSTQTTTGFECKYDCPVCL